MAIYEIRCHSLTQRVFASSERMAIAHVIDEHGITETTLAVRRGYRTSIYDVRGGKAKLVSTRFNNHA